MDVIKDIFKEDSDIYKEYKQMWAAFTKKLKPGIKYIFANYGKMLLVFLPVSLLSIINLVFPSFTKVPLIQ